MNINKIPLVKYHFFILIHRLSLWEVSILGKSETTRDKYNKDWIWWRPSLYLFYLLQQPIYNMAANCKFLKAISILWCVFVHMLLLLNIAFKPTAQTLFILPKRFIQNRMLKKYQLFLLGVSCPNNSILSLGCMTSYTGSVTRGVKNTRYSDSVYLFIATNCLLASLKNPLTWVYMCKCYCTINSPWI